MWDLAKSFLTFSKKIRLKTVKYLLLRELGFNEKVSIFKEENENNKSVNFEVELSWHRIKALHLISIESKY